MVGSHGKPTLCWLFGTVMGLLVGQAAAPVRAGTGIMSCWTGGWGLPTGEGTLGT